MIKEELVMTSKQTTRKYEIDIDHGAIDEYFACITACSLNDNSMHCITQCIEIQHHRVAQNRLTKEEE